MRSLSPVLREVFILHYLEGLPYTAIAEILGVTPGAARLRAKRAREALRANLAPMLPPEVRRRLESEDSGRA